MRSPFVNEDQPPGIKSVLVFLPLRQPSRDLRAILLAGEQAFLKLWPALRSSDHIVLGLTR